MENEYTLYEYRVELTPKNDFPFFTTVITYEEDERDIARLAIDKEELNHVSVGYDVISKRRTRI